jgi:MFS family permease
LFTPRFFVMCGYSFTVFLSAFQLFPTAPFHIIDLGGSTAASGLFLGFLTYSSALSAPLTGAYADRVGTKRVLIGSSLALVVFSLLYAVITSVAVLLALVVLHGIFWSGLLSASAAYMTSLLPESRRAEGIGYWGLSTLAAVAVAPTVGFWFYNRGWLWLCLLTAALNLVMALIATQLHEKERPVRPKTEKREGLLEWRVLIVSVTLALYSFGYGGITSFTALYADASGVSPKGIYLTTLAIVILVTRPMFGHLGDRIGYRKVFIPCLVLIACGLAILAFGGSRTLLLASAIVFGTGFGVAYPTYVGYVMRDVGAARRGAAFGAVLAAFDTGIGTGSTAMGWLIDRHSFGVAFGVAAALAALALPYFLFIDRFYSAAAVERSSHPR